MTKAPDKVKNIEEAIGVFENWLEENGGGASNKNAKSGNEEEKVETVAGLGFKDKAAAEKTLKYDLTFVLCIVITINETGLSLTPTEFWKDEIQIINDSLLRD